MKLIDAPVGLLTYKGILLFKSEYRTDRGNMLCTPDVYIVESGEYFCGDAKTYEDYNSIEVEVVNAKKVRKWGLKNGLRNI